MKTKTLKTHNLKPYSVLQTRKSHSNSSTAHSPFHITRNSGQTTGTHGRAASRRRHGACTCPSSSPSGSRSACGSTASTSSSNSCSRSAAASAGSSRSSSRSSSHSWRSRRRCVASWRSIDLARSHSDNNHSRRIILIRIHDLAGSRKICVGASRRLSADGSGCAGKDAVVCEGEAVPNQK